MLLAHGPGEMLLRIPTDTLLTKVIPDGPVRVADTAILLSGPVSVSYLYDPALDNAGHTLLEVPAGDYYVYLVGPSRPLRISLTFEDIPGTTELAMQPWAGVAFPLQSFWEGLGLSQPPIYNFVRDISSTAVSTRTALITVQETDVIAFPGATEMVSWHSVQDGSESDCQEGGGGELIVLGLLIGGTGIRANRLFVVDPGEWTLKIEYASVGTGITVSHRAFGVAIPLVEDDPLQHWKNPYWSGLWQPPLDAVPTPLRQTAQSVTCSAVAAG